MALSEDNKVPLRPGLGWNKGLRAWVESASTWLCAAAALVSVLVTFSIVVLLGKETVEFLGRPEVTLVSFLTGTRWAPTFDDAAFGVLPLVCGTLMITIGSALLAVPLGLGVAVYLTEYASPRLRAVLKPTLEVLGGIPTVVYGFFGLYYVTPLLRTFIPGVEVFNALSGSIVVGVMVLPMVCSLCDDALHMVPRGLREGALALGSTRSETVVKVQIPGALSGITAAFVLALSRAIGETMAVTIAAGQQPRLTWDPRVGIETMTAFIVQVSKGDTPAGSTAYLTLFAVGALLFALTMLLNIVATRIIKRFRLRYS